MRRGGRLDALKVRVQCSAPWEAMTGEGPSRFCADCQRHVVDFAQLTPEEARARLQASRGRLCGRLTHRDGELVLAPAPAPPEVATSWARKRLSGLAATVAGVFLGAGAASAQSAGAAPAIAAAPAAAKPEPAAARPRQAGAATGALRGLLADESGPVPGAAIEARNTLDGALYRTTTRATGEFAFAALPAGLYDLSGSGDAIVVEALTGVAVHPAAQQEVQLSATADDVVTVGGGVMMISEQPLRLAFHDSELVVAGEVGPSVVVGRKGEVLEVITDLRIDTVLKGEMAAGHVLYRHYTYRPPEEGWPRESTPIVAFLDRVPGERLHGEPVFVASDDVAGLRELDDVEIVGYVERLEALAKVERRAERRGESDPGEIVEWLVATAEEPATRADAAGELASAFWTLAERAENEGLSVDAAAADLLAVVERFRAGGGTLREAPRPEVLAAFLDQAQRERLTAALVSSPTLADGERMLFGLVRRWDDRAAMEWLAQRLPDAEPDAEGFSTDSSELYWLGELAEELEDVRLTAILDAAEERIDALAEPAEGETLAASARRLEDLAAERRELLQAYASRLAAIR